MSNPSATKPNEPESIERTRWKIDPARSRVEFRTLTFWGMMLVEGRFDRYDGTLDLEDDPAIELKIEAASLDTNSKKRDAPPWCLLIVDRWEHRGPPFDPLSPRGG